MDVQVILDDIDRQFAQLRRVRELFVSMVEGGTAPAKRPRQPKGLAGKTPEASTPAPKRTAKPATRAMSADAKARIAAAQKKRWAAQKQAQAPATRKYAAKPKAAKKKAAPSKKTTPSDTPAAIEAATADA